MTPQQISLIRQSFTPLAGNSAAVGDAFYRRLFEIDPSLRAMFARDLGEQRARMMRMLARIVDNLHDIESLIDVAGHLGVSHMRYGVEERHYHVVGQALLDTLGAGLGARFDEATREAWTVAYGTLSAVMIEAARGTMRPAA